MVVLMLILMLILSVCDIEEVSPVLNVAKQDYYECVRVLYELRVDINLCDNLGNSPIKEAVKYERVNFIKQLLSYHVILHPELA